MYCVGLTGGIASGKTTVSNIFSDLGVTIVDTDVIARLVVEPGSICLKKIVEHFGNKILDENNSLNRKALREIIFSNPLEKGWLEALMHPIIRQETRSQIESATGPYVILSSPLLIESPDLKLVDRVLVVDTTQESQMKRTLARDGVDEAQIKKTIATQIARDERLAHADDIIDNSGTIEETQKAVKQLHSTYIKLSQK